MRTERSLKNFLHNGVGAPAGCQPVKQQAARLRYVPSHD